MPVLPIFVALKNVARKKSKGLTASESHKIMLRVCYILIDDNYVLAGIVSRSAKAIF